MEKEPSKQFEPYPNRTMTVSDEVWELLKQDKGKSGMTWTNYFKEFLKEKQYGNETVQQVRRE